MKKHKVIIRKIVRADGKVEIKPEKKIKIILIRST